MFSQATPRSQVMPATLSSLYTSDVFGNLWNGLFSIPSEPAPPPPAVAHHAQQQQQHVVSRRVQQHQPAISHARAEPTYPNPVAQPIPVVTSAVPSQQQQPTGSRPGQAFYADLIWAVGDRNGANPAPHAQTAEMARQVSSQSQYSDGSSYSDGSAMPSRPIYSPLIPPTQVELDHYSTSFSEIVSHGLRVAQVTFFDTHYHLFLPRHTLFGHARSTLFQCNSSSQPSPHRCRSCTSPRGRPRGSRRSSSTPCALAARCTTTVPGRRRISFTRSQLRGRLCPDTL